MVTRSSEKVGFAFFRNSTWLDVSKSTRQRLERSYFSCVLVVQTYMARLTISMGKRPMPWLQIQEIDFESYICYWPPNWKIFWAKKCLVEAAVIGNAPADTMEARSAK
jgi:hypothetical protein